MKLEVGMSFEEKHKWLEENLERDMYVRTGNGIDRFQYKYKEKDHTFYTYHFEKTSMTNPEYYIIGEPSFNIMDLIQKGDYVNGNKVLFKRYKEYPNPQLNHYSLETNGYEVYTNDIDIATIVTKEQYESMAYKVGGSNE